MPDFTTEADPLPRRPIDSTSDDAGSDHILRHCQGLEAEQRVSCKALYFWNRIRAGRRLPQMAEAAFIAEPEIGDHMFVVIPGNGGGRFVIQRCGPLLAALHGGDPRGRPLGEALPLILGSRAEECCGDALLTRQPMLAAGTIMLESGDEFRYRMIALPMGESDDAVDHLIGTLSFTVETDRD